MKKRKEESRKTNAQSADGMQGRKLTYG